MGPFATLVERVRTADDFLAVAETAICELRALSGVHAVAITAHDARGWPAAWLGSDDFDRARVRAYLDGLHREDPSLARVRDRGAVRLDRVTAVSQRLLAAWGHHVVTAVLWIVPILGDELLGTLRVAVADGDDPRWQELGVAGVHVSVRLAKLGIGAPLAAHAEAPALTARQREVAWLVARGCTNAEIASMLGVSANAVKKHVSRVLALLHVTNRTELAAITGRWSESSTRRSPAARVHVMTRSTSASESET